MKKKFKYKYNNKHNNNFKYFLGLILILVIFYVGIKIIMFVNNKLNNKLFVNNILSYSNSYIKKNHKSYTLNILTMTKPVTIIGANYKGLVKNEVVIDKTIRADETVSGNPQVFIYSTHSGETYTKSNNNNYNINPTVSYPRHILEEKLEKMGINCIVDETDVIGVLNSNGWSYDQSYNVSKMIILDAKKKYPSLKYFIDIHRDSALINTTKLIFNDVAYARLLFIVGMENKNYSSNLEITNALNESLNNNIFNITRGIYKKEGPGVNGIYNQDLSKNGILLEVGGVDNNILEVYNSISLFAQVYGNYILKNKDNM